MGPAYVAGDGPLLDSFAAIREAEWTPEELRLRELFADPPNVEAVVQAITEGRTVYADPRELERFDVDPDTVNAHALVRLAYEGVDIRLERPSALDPLPAERDDDAPGVRFVPLDAFADTDEEGEEAVLGDRDNAVIPEDGDVMVYGDGGAGKTTLLVDFAFHLAAGDDWLGVAVSAPRRVLIIENEGPRARFRRKLRRKRDAWGGSPIGDRVTVLESPWAAFTFAEERWRDVLADYLLARAVDVVIVGPVASAGMNTAGTLQDVREFLGLTADVRRRSGRRLVVILVHHENKGGKVSGAWEGAGDTLVHVSKQAHGRMRLEWQKTRWASDYHATALSLLWGDGDTFTVEENDELDDETLGEKIVEAVAVDPGTSWRKVEKATKGVNRERRMAVRDELFRIGRIVNVRRRKGEPDVVLDHVEEASPSRLFLSDDPAILQLLPTPGAVGEQSAPGGATRSFSPAPEGAHSRKGVPPGGAVEDGGPNEADEWAERIRELGLDG